MRNSTVALILLTAMAGPFALAEEAMPKPERRTGGSYYRLSMFDYKPGRADEAKEIVESYFFEAGKAIGWIPTLITPLSGRWDQIILLPMGHTTDELEFVRTERGVKWFEALVEVAGGREEADRIYEAYEETILLQRSEIVFLHDR